MKMTIFQELKGETGWDASLSRKKKPDSSELFGAIAHRYEVALQGKVKKINPYSLF